MLMENERLTCFYCAADAIKTSVQNLAKVRNKSFTSSSACHT